MSAPARSKAIFGKRNRPHRKNYRSHHNFDKYLP